MKNKNYLASYNPGTLDAVRAWIKSNLDKADYI